jgi:carbon monoxide dehydrogenase subunit G
MTTVSVTTEIAAPLERVFDVFTDLEQSAARVSNIQKIELLSVGEFKLGTRWLETREVLGRTDTAEMEVTAFEQPRTYTVTHHKGGARIDAVFTFEPRGDATRVQIEFALGGPGLPPGMLAPVRWAIADRVRDVIAQDLDDLKGFIEQQR